MPERGERTLNSLDPNSSMRAFPFLLRAGGARSPQALVPGPAFFSALRASAGPWPDSGSPLLRAAEG